LEPNVPDGTEQLELNKHLILTNMKKEYLEPEVRIAQIGFEVNFLASEITIGGFEVKTSTIPMIRSTRGLNV
jgi:hypothetical protein